MADSTQKDARAVRLGEWLAGWRQTRGLNRPETVSEALKHDPRANISTDYLAKLEYGTRNLATASPDVREALRLALNISREEWEKETKLLVPMRVQTQTLGTMMQSQGWTRAGTGGVDSAVVVDLELIVVMGMSAAGTGVYSDTDAIGYVYVEREIARHPNRVTFAIEGSSMEPTMSHGDAIHVDSADTDLRDGKIYLVEVDGNGYAVKRARQYEGGAWWLVSDNPAFPPLPRTEARVVGRVFSVSPQARRL